MPWPHFTPCNPSPVWWCDRRRPHQFCGVTEDEDESDGEEERGHHRVAALVRGYRVVDQGCSARSRFVLSLLHKIYCICTVFCTLCLLKVLQKIYHIFTFLCTYRVLKVEDLFWFLN